MAKNKPTIHKSSRTIIENKLLVALEDPGNVAVILKEHELKTLIDAMVCLAGATGATEAERAKVVEMTADLVRLQEATFG